MSYLANRIRVGDRETPYSLVTALDSPPAPAADDGITLNEWAARDLAAKPGDTVTLDYYVWKSDGRLDTATAQFRLAQIVPIAGAAADREFAPDYPGITESDSLHDWDPPFPLDLTRVRPDRRAVLEAVSHHAQSLRSPGARPPALGNALRQPDVDPHLPAIAGICERAARGASIRRRWA